MYQKMHKLIPVAGLLACMAAATDAFAGTPVIGGTIVYGPPAAQSIPVLTDLMLAVLGLLLAVTAYRVLRTRPGGQPLASLAALAIVGLSMVPGGKLIEQAHAIIILGMTSPSGGTIEIPGGAEYPVPNNSGVVQEVKSVTPAQNYESESTASSPTCTAGLTVQPTDSCYVYFVLPPS